MMRNSFSNSSANEIVLSCDTASRRIAIGPAYVLGGDTAPPPARTVPEDRRAAEAVRFNAGLAEAQRTYAQSLAGISGLPVELRDCIRGMLEAEIGILSDPGLGGRVLKRIEAGDNAPHAVHAEFTPFLEQLRAQPFSARMAEPVESVMKALLHTLEPSLRPAALSTAPDGSVPVVPAMPVGEMSHFRDHSGALRLPGMLNSGGTPTDHTNIIANSIGALVGRVTAGELAQLKTGDTIIIDGLAGQVILNPAPDTLRRYEEAVSADRALQETLRARASAEAAPPRTRDGETIAVLGSITLSDDVPAVNASHADGIGLYRTELAVQAYETVPGERFWKDVFTDIVSRTETGKVVIRTIDFDGDKANKHFEGQDKLDLITRRQMAAALATAQSQGYDRVAVMVPLVASAEHLASFQAVMNEEALKKNVAPIKLGTMVEVPAFVDDLRDADAAFFSIGTNDLIANTLGFSRFGSETKNYDPSHPAVLAAIGKTVAAGNDKNIPVSVCGDMAADPRYFALLAGAGVRNLSVGPAAVPAIKELARRVDTNEARALYDAVRSTPDRAQRAQMIDDFNRRLGLENGNLTLGWSPPAAPAATTQRRPGVA